MSEKLTPEIRFNGFNDAWRKRKFCEIFDSTIPNNTLPRSELNYESGEVKNIHYGDILVKLGAYVDVVNETLPFITNGKIDDYKSRLLQDGDVVFADTAEDETTGKAVEVANVNDSNIVCGLHTIAYRPNRQISPYFSGYYFNSDSFRKQLLPLMQGIKVLSLNKSSLSKTSTIIPTTLPEQQKIGNFFRTLDDAITLHQRKLDGLKKLKAGFLQQMFPREGESVPRVRFSGFNGEWERRRLGEVSESYSGGTPTVGKVEYYGGSIPFIRSAEVNADKTELFITDMGLKNSSAKMVNVGDILYALYGATSGEVGRSKIVGAINQAILAIKPLSGYDCEFIAQWLRNEKENIISTYLQGGQGNLSATIVKDLDMLLPTLPEQQKIGSFFRNIDAQISTQQTQADKLKMLKTAYLQKMFV
jgi:type I restriction enzyme S subunit